MAIQKINLGTEPHGVGGDSYRTANEKINSNFEEVVEGINGVSDNNLETLDKLSEEVLRAKKAESDLNANIIKEVSDRKLEVARLDEADAVLQAQINSVGGGKLAYKTYAEMIADKSNIAEKSSIDIIADTDDKNGTYLYDGTNFVKSQYDLEKLIRAKVQNTFGTYAQMVASNLSDGAYALVADDESDKNGVYIKDGGAWVKSKYDLYSVFTSDFYKLLINNGDVVFSSNTKNLFDPVRITKGFYVNSSGQLQKNTNAVVSEPIYIKGAEKVTVSGLKESVSYRGCRFLDKDKNFLPPVAAAIPPARTYLTWSVPTGAVWLQFGVRGTGDVWELELDTVQLEVSSSATSFEPYEKGKLLSMFGVELPSKGEVVQIIKNEVNPVYEPKTKNIFNPERVLYGFRVNSGDIEVAPSENYSASDYIDVSGLNKVTISGLTPISFYRGVAFLDEGKNSTSFVSIQPNRTSATFSVPVNSKYLAFGIGVIPSRHDDDVYAIQVESGGVATDFVPYEKKSVSGIFGLPISGAQTLNSSSMAFGAKFLLFGDSITETCDVDNDDFSSNSHRNNWPKHLASRLSPSIFRNYAKSGASFQDRNLLHYQFLGNQINKAIENGETPDIIVVAIGTNDGGGTPASFSDVMSKETLDELNTKNLGESIRWAFWKIRMQFPDAICFYANPIQSAGSRLLADHPNSWIPLFNQLAKRYGFILIDQHYESGIIKELEVVQGNGKYLYDGLHPNPAGVKRQADYIISKITSSV